jgi:hypothetical protein
MPQDLALIAALLLMSAAAGLFARPEVAARSVTGPTGIGP